MDCIFCKIIHKTIPAKIAYEDEEVLAFHDLHPQAPVHMLVIPKKHISTINQIEPQDQMLAGKLLLTAQKLAKEQGFADAGFRVVMNCNEQGGQTVYHIHMHVLAGRHMTWPPG